MDITLLVICVANYCRSPVAKNIFIKQLNSNFSVESCGLINYKKEGMDERSKKFLEKLSFNSNDHVPKIISAELVKNANIIYALDKTIVLKLKKIFPEAGFKIRLINGKSIVDPIRQDDATYEQTMQDIFLATKLEAEKLNKLF